MPGLDTLFPTGQTPLRDTLTASGIANDQRVSDNRARTEELNRLREQLELEKVGAEITRSKEAEDRLVGPQRAAQERATLKLMTGQDYPSVPDAEFSRIYKEGTKAADALAAKAAKGQITERAAAEGVRQILDSTEEELRRLGVTPADIDNELAGLDRQREELSTVATEGRAEDVAIRAEGREAKRDSAALSTPAQVRAQLEAARSHPSYEKNFAAQGVGAALQAGLDAGMEGEALGRLAQDFTDALQTGTGTTLTGELPNQRGTQTSIEEDIRQGQKSLRLLDDAVEKFNSTFLTLPGKLRKKFGDVFNYVTNAPVDKAFRTQMASFNTVVSEGLTAYIKRMTGAQMSEVEVPRLKAGVPNLDDDPVTFYAKAITVMGLIEESVEIDKRALDAGVSQQDREDRQAAAASEVNDKLEAITRGDVTIAEQEDIVRAAFGQGQGDEPVLSPEKHAELERLRKKFAEE